MSKKLSFEQIQRSLCAVNSFEKIYGKSFVALVAEKKFSANCSNFSPKEKIVILRGMHSDHNMPFVLVKNETYCCDYNVIENNGDCLTIKLKDKTIDILPDKDDLEQENGGNE